MLTHPTLDKLQTLRLTGMYQALVEQLQMPDIAALTFEERFGLLVDRELHGAGKPAADHALAPGQAAPDRLHRRYRLSASTGIG